MALKLAVLNQIPKWITFKRLKYKMQVKKLCLTILCFTVMLSNTALANGHIILVSNNTSKNIFYSIQAHTWWGTGHRVKPGASSNYKTKMTDKSGVEIRSDQCKHWVGKICTSADTSKLAPCIVGKYIADQIYSIDIDTRKHCIVTCMDKTTTSCLTAGF